VKQVNISKGKDVLSEHLTRLGRKGGQAKTEAKREASRKNLEKALEARWHKPYRIGRNKT
jgi:hypothetical protein